MKRGLFFLICFFLAASLVNTKAENTKGKSVKLYKTTEQIAIHGLGYDNPNPIFEMIGCTSESKLIYPYPIHNYHLREPRKKDIELVTMENDFLRISFAPEFGGRIWSAIDKQSGEEMFFHNNSFKSYLSGGGGAYIAGGMELNYPTAHSITNCMPRKVEGIENEDGSVTVTVSEWERVYRTQWQMSFTLRPGEARILQHVLFYNRSHLPGRYRYWSNPSCPLSNEVKFIYPEKMASEHGGSNIFTWPVYLDVDWSYCRNMHEIFGFYFLDAKDDFFGYYDSGRNFGVVHYGDRHNVPGKKLWSWGNTKLQEQRKAFLSEGLGGYGEFQSGRPVNQEHFEFLLPQEIIHWDEVWFPVKGTGDFIQATDALAIAVEKTDCDKGILRVFANSPVNGVTAKIIIQGKEIMALPIKLHTQQLLSKEFNLGGASVNDILIQFINACGSVFEEACPKGRGQYKKRSEIHEEPIYDVRSSYSAYLTGAFKDMIGATDEAEKFYNQAIKLDPFNPEPIRNLGVMMLLRGRLSDAKKMLLKAIECNKWDGLARYFLAYAALVDGDIDTAYDQAGWAAGMYWQKVNGEILAAEAAGQKGLFVQAAEHLQRASENATLQVKIPAMKAAYLRNLGRRDEARMEIEEAKKKQIEEILINFEDFFLNSTNTKEEILTLADNLHRDPYRFIEAALDYIAMGLYEDAIRVCGIGIDLGTYLWREPVQYNTAYVLSRFKQKHINPFLFLVRGYAMKKCGKLKETKSDYNKADVPCYYLFANQPEVEQILKDAIETIESKGALEYYLGTYLMSKKRYDQALIALLEAEKKGLEFDVLYRNIAVLYWKCGNSESQNIQTAKAEKYYRKAIALTSDDFNPYIELASMYAEIGERDKQHELIMSIPENYITSFPSIVSLALESLAERGDIKGYRDFVKMVNLSKWEGEGKAAYLYSRITLGKALFDKGCFDKALKEFSLATKYPSNFGTAELPLYVFPFPRLNYLKGLCLEKLSRTDEARNSFEIASTELYGSKSIEKNKVYYLEGIQAGLSEARFYQALALKKLGKEAQANVTMDSVNYYRQSRGLIPLRFRLEDESRMGMADPNSAPVKIVEGPEI